MLHGNSSGGGSSGSVGVGGYNNHSHSDYTDYSEYNDYGSQSTNLSYPEMTSLHHPPGPGQGMMPHHGHNTMHNAIIPHSMNDRDGGMDSKESPSRTTVMALQSTPKRVIKL